MISDYFPLEKRGQAIGIYSLGANFGMFIGMGLGGYIASEFGWRYTFLFIGLPGLLVALILKLTVKEPPRGMSDKIEGEIKDIPFIDTLKYLFTLKSYRQLCIAGSLAALSGFGFMYWVPVFLERIHGMQKSEYGIFLGMVFGIVGGISTFLGGFISDRMSKRSRKWAMYTAVIGVLYGLITGVVFEDLPIHIVVLPYFLLVMGGIFGTRVETLKENYKLYKLIKGERQ